MALTKIKTGSVSDSITLTTPDINGGTIDGTTVGASSASTGAFTTLSASGVLTANAGVVVDNFTLDGTTLALSSGNLTLDVAGDIRLDAGGGNTQLIKGGTEFGRFFEAGTNDFYIYNPNSDKDIIVYGNDAGTSFEAVRFDMSAAGAATFNAGVVINESGVDADFRVESDGNANALFVDGGNNSVGLFAGAGDTVNANLAIGLTGVVVAGNTDGATIGKASTVKLINSNNGGSTNAGVFLLGGGTGGSVGQISSGLGFFRENSANWGTQLRFYTHPTATSDLDALNEVMRINADGDLSWHQTPSSSASGISFNNTTHPSITVSGGGDTQFRHRVVFVNGNGTVGIISTNGSATTYATSSDYRLKENVVPMTGSIDRVKALKPSRFNFIVDADRTVDGFIAHEVQAVVPEAISGTKDAMKDEEYEVTAAVEEVRDADDNVTTEAAEAVMGTRSVPDMQGIDQSKLVPLLVAALQEAIARIEILEGA